MPCLESEEKRRTLYFGTKTKYQKNSRVEVDTAGIETVKKDNQTKITKDGERNVEADINGAGILTNNGAGILMNEGAGILMNHGADILMNNHHFKMRCLRLRLQQLQQQQLWLQPLLPAVASALAAHRRFRFQQVGLQHRQFQQLQLQLQQVGLQHRRFQQLRLQFQQLQQVDPQLRLQVQKLQQVGLQHLQLQHRRLQNLQLQPLAPAVP